MDWRNFGVKYEIEGVGTLWLHPGDPFRSELVRSEIEAWGVDLLLSVSWAFIIIEAYVLDAEIENAEHPIALYLSNRAKCDDNKERWELHQSLLSVKEFMMLYDAFSDTRPTELLELEGDENGVEKKSATSQSLESTPSESESETVS